MEQQSSMPEQHDIRRFVVQIDWRHFWRWMRGSGAAMPRLPLGIRSIKESPQTVRITGTTTISNLPRNLKMRTRA